MKRLSPGKRKHLIHVLELNTGHWYSGVEEIKASTLDDPRVREAIREYAQGFRRWSDHVHDAVQRNNALLGLMSKAKA